MKLRRAGGELVPLREHLLALMAEKDIRDQQRFDAQGQELTAALLAADRAVQTAMIAAEKAVAKAETANEKRFESVNEFRKTLSDQTASFPSRVELSALADRVTDLGTRMDKAEGHTSGLSDGTKLLIQVVSVVLAAIGLYLALRRNG
jgi:hypothetical protein